MLSSSITLPATVNKTNDAVINKPIAGQGSLIRQAGCSEELAVKKGEEKTAKECAEMAGLGDGTGEV